MGLQQARHHGKLAKRASDEWPEPMFRVQVMVGTENIQNIQVP